MAYIHKKFLRTLMVFIVFFSAIAPVYGATIAPILAPALTSFISGPFTSGSLKVGSERVTNVNTIMPCHKNKATKLNKNTPLTQQAACFKHCLNQLNTPYIAATAPEVEEKTINQTSVNYDLTLSQVIKAAHMKSLSNKDPPSLSQPSCLPWQVRASNSHKGLSALLLNTSRLRR